MKIVPICKKHALLRAIAGWGDASIAEASNQDGQNLSISDSTRGNLTEIALNPGLHRLRLRLTYIEPD